MEQDAGREGREAAHQRRMRTLNRLVLGGCALFLPLYLVIRFTGGSADRLEMLPDLFARVKTPIVWEVPEGGVRYLHFFHGDARPEHKFVLIRIRLEARMKIGYPVVPRCFRLVDDEQHMHYPMTDSPLFIRKGDSFHLDRDDVIEDELVFEIPAGRAAQRLLFDRYQE